MIYLSLSIFLEIVFDLSRWLRFFQLRWNCWFSIELPPLWYQLCTNTKRLFWWIASCGIDLKVSHRFLAITSCFNRFIHSLRINKWQRTLNSIFLFTIFNLAYNLIKQFCWLFNTLKIWIYIILAVIIFSIEIISNWFSIII